MQNDQTKKQIFWYKIKLFAVKSLFFVAACLVLYFFLNDYSKTQTSSSEEGDVLVEHIGDKSDEELSFQNEEPLDFPNDNTVENAFSQREELYSHDLQNQITEIINSIEIEDFLYDDHAVITKESIQEDEDNDGEIITDNVVIKEESYEPEKDQKSVQEQPIDSRFMIAIVIDDLGISQQHSKEVLDIDAKLTASFLTYGKNLKALTDLAKSSGKEVIVHIPMEPYAASNTAPDQLNIAMSDEEIKNNLKIILEHFDADLVGGNNHMGSKFTENREKMSAVMEVLQERKMFFLDSKTSGKAIGCEVAKDFDVDCVSRDVFLDNENKFDYIMNQLKQTEKVAARKGYAIAIGHPKTEMIAALKEWIETLDNKKYRLVYLSEIIEKIKNTKKNP